MNPEVKAKWVAALRSGKYDQGRGQLRSPDGYFCCLGVLCELAVAENVTTLIKVEQNNPDYLVGSHFDYYYGKTKNQEVPPIEVREWAGFIRNEIPDLRVDDEEAYGGESMTEIVTLNDEECYTFEQLADLIEEQL